MAKPVSWVAVRTANLAPAAFAACTHWSVFSWVGLKIIFYRLDAVVALTVFDAIEDMEIIMEDDAHFRLVPFQLVRGRTGDIRLLSRCRENTCYQ